jgi:type IV secretion system protein VirD4
MIQYLAQAKEHYTESEAKVFANIKTKIAFATDDYQDAEFISKLLGHYTQRIDSNSYSVQYRGNSRSNNFQYQSLPLFRTEKIMNLKNIKMIIIQTGAQPFSLQKNGFFLSWGDLI